MATWSTGSVAEHITALVGTKNIPTAVSGTVLNDLISQRINHIEQYTGQNIDDNSIAEKFQPAIINLSMAKLLLSIESNQGGINSARLGPLSVGEIGEGGNLPTAQMYETNGRLDLRELGRKSRFKRSIGC